jgi:DNA-binding SARP family transcriptional activator
MRTRPEVPCSVLITVEEGHAAGTTYEVTEFPVVLGRGSQADVRLPDDAQNPTLSRQHARLHLRGGRVYIEDMSTTGTRLGSREMFPREVAATNGEPVWLGPKTKLRITVSASAAPVDLAALPALDHMLRVRCLGGFSVTADGQDIPEGHWESRKTMMLTAWLADARSPVSSQRLTEVLWADSEDGGRAALQTTISRLRRAFRKTVPAFPDPVVFSQGNYSLNPDCGLQLDVHEFEATCAQARTLQTSGQWMDSLPLVQRALALYSGSYLEGLSDDWIDLRRTTLASRYTELVGRVAAWHEGENRFEEAQHTFERLLATDACSEPGRLGVMRCLLAQGKREDAIRHYQEAVRTLRKALDLDPSPAMTALYTSITKSTT